MEAKNNQVTTGERAGGGKRADRRKRSVEFIKAGGGAFSPLSDVAGSRGSGGSLGKEPEIRGGLCIFRMRKSAEATGRMG